MIFSCLQIYRNTEVSFVVSADDFSIELDFCTIIRFPFYQDITIRWGPTGMGAADDTDFRVPQGVTIVFDMGRDKDYVRFFNRSATTAADIWYLPLSKF